MLRNVTRGVSSGFSSCSVAAISDRLDHLYSAGRPLMICKNHIQSFGLLGEWSQRARGVKKRETQRSPQDHREIIARDYMRGCCTRVWDPLNQHSTWILKVTKLSAYRLLALVCCLRLLQNSQKNPHLISYADPAISTRQWGKSRCRRVSCWGVNRP